MHIGQITLYNEAVKVVRRWDDSLCPGLAQARDSIAPSTRHLNNNATSSPSVELFHFPPEIAALLIEVDSSFAIKTTLRRIAILPRFD